VDKRPLSQLQRSWLLGEIKVWQAQGLVRAEQAEDILGLYEMPNESAARQQSWGLFALRAVAALFVGLAVFLVIGYNWTELPTAIKLIILFGALLSAQGTAFYLRYRRNARLASELTFFFGCLLYGASIWLIAQIFHLNAHYPDGFWVWALGVLPFALALDTLLLHALLIAILAIWVGTEILDPSPFAFARWFFGLLGWPGLPNGAYTLPLLAVPGLLWSYRKGSPFTAGLYVALLTWWTVLQPFAWDWKTNPIFFIVSLGGLLMVLSEIHRSGSPFAIPYRFCGVLLTLGTLIPLSFRDYYHLWPDLSYYGGIDKNGRFLGPGIIQPLAILAVSMLVVGGTLFVILRRREGEARLTRPVRAFVSRQWLPLGLVLLMTLSSLWVALARESLLPMILANLAMLASAFWLIQVGTREERGRPFATGVLYFLLWAVLRYFDLFGGFGGMLGGAFLFFLCGVTLFVVSLYWRQRKQRRIAL
jgi:uncharacterized membrane protein